MARRGPARRLVTFTIEGIAPGDLAADSISAASPFVGRHCAPAASPAGAEAPPRASRDNDHPTSTRWWRIMTSARADRAQRRPSPAVATSRSARPVSAVA
jgi:hypothetical protein